MTVHRSFHVIHWLDGGPTDLDNLALACGHHHDQIHHRGWSIWINPQRPALRNTYWDTEQDIRDAVDNPRS